MLGFKPTPDTPNADLKTGARPALKPAATYDPPGTPARPTAGIGTRPAAPPAQGTARDTQQPAVSAASVHDVAPRQTAPAREVEPAEARPTQGPGSRLHVGINIKLKGVEITDCDALVIEGHVEATVNSKAMQIDKPGTLKGTALIDVAEIHGEFTGELTARTRLVVHATGRVSGTIRYGKLIVAEGGEVSGDVKRLDSSTQPAPAHTPRPPSPDSRPAHATHGQSST